MRQLSCANRIGLLIALCVISIGGVLFVDPIPQDLDYHLFADTRAFMGIPNFGDVTSNVGYGIVGVLGLMILFGQQREAIFDKYRDSLPYGIFFIGVALVSAGSAYYHWAPSNATLFWDRLPMTVAFMVLFSALITDRIHRSFGLRWSLPILIILGIVSLLYWDMTEAQGQGDLRFYALVQFYPMLALPVICWLFPKAQYTGGGYLVWVVVWYVVAKALEHFDSEVFDLLGGIVSGHSLKHLASALAPLMVLRMIQMSNIRCSSRNLI